VNTHDRSCTILPPPRAEIPVAWKGRDEEQVNVQELIAMTGGEVTAEADDAKAAFFDTDEPMKDNAATAKSVNVHEVIVALVVRCEQLGA
jgi:hypothetical protein